ncbi:MAG TPA: hypothetical protein VFX30_08830 [bacterium]|nr:hypothetical protein [bacterium]
MKRLRLFLMPAALLAVSTFTSGYTVKGFFSKYMVTKPAAQTTTVKTPSAVSRDFLAEPEETIGARSEITKMDSKLYIPESGICTDVQDHAASVKAIMNADEKTVLFNDACFLYNELISVWEKSSCQTQPPQRVDCCAEMNGKYWFHYDHLQIAGRWNTCSYWLYAYSCQRVNAAKQQCDVMGCSQNCDWAYDCSQNGYSGFFSSFPMNAGHEANLASCLKN